MSGDGNTELDTLLGVLQRHIQGALSDSHGLCRNADPARIETRHGDLEPVSFPAQEVGLGHPAVGQDDRADRIGPHAAVIFEEPHFEPGRTPLHHGWR